MPLIALLDGERIDSVLATDEDWVELKKVHKTRSLLATCGLPAFPRTSSQGLRHFVHKSGVKCEVPECWAETSQHRAAKSIVARAAAEAGWDVTLERPAEDRSWIADVLVEKNGRRLAIEIQWSKQDVSEFAFRQERYAAAGIECFWFVHRRNKLAAEDAGVPYLVFDGDGLPLDVRAREAFQEEELAPLAGVVKLILDGGYLDRVQAKATAVTFELAEMSCFACHRDSTVWRIESVAVRTRCQQTTAFEAPGYSLWAKERVEAGLYEIARASIAGVAPLAPLRSHYSKTAKSAYLAYGCAHCARGFFGDFFVGNNYDWDEVTIPVTVRIPLSQELLTHRHVCLDNGFGRCSQDAQHHDGPAFGDHGNTEYEDGVDTISMAEILDKMTGRGYRWR